MDDQKSILKRLEELERENRALKKAVQGGEKAKETTTMVGMYKGHPMITFNGPFRPFSLGVRKASVVLSKIKEVEHFVENNKKYLSKEDPTEKIGDIV